MATKKNIIAKQGDGNFFTGTPVSLEGMTFVNPYEIKQPEVVKEQPKTGALGFIADRGIDLVKGAISVPEAAVGLGSMVSGGRVGQMAESMGFRPKEAKEILSGMQTEGYRDKQRQFQDADGVVAKLGTAVTNPSLIAGAITESLPLMAAGGVLARGALTVAPKAGIAAVAGGEGLVSAGSAAETIRQQTADGGLTGEQAALAGATGLAVGGFGLLGAKIAQKLGIADVDSLVAGVARSGPEVQKSAVRRVLEGAVAEGLLEELPQSVAEQVLQNKALGRPLSEGVDGAAVMGALSGAAMGGGANLLARQPPQEEKATTPEPAAPITPSEPVPSVGIMSMAANLGTTLTNRAAADLLTPKPDPFMTNVKAMAEDRRQDSLADDAMSKLEAMYQSDLKAMNAQRFADEPAASQPAPIEPAEPEMLPFAQEGDILKGDEPFKNILAAKTQAQKTPGEVVQVFGGWIVRPAKTQAAQEIQPITAQPLDNAAPVAIESVANEQNQEAGTPTGQIPSPAPDQEAAPMAGNAAGRPVEPTATASAPVESVGVKDPASWVIKNKKTGEIVLETFDKKKVDALNTTTYEAVPIREHLESLSKKPVDRPTPAAQKENTLTTPELLESKTVDGKTVRVSKADFEAAKLKSKEAIRLIGEANKEKKSAKIDSVEEGIAIWKGRKGQEILAESNILGFSYTSGPEYDARVKNWLDSKQSTKVIEGELDKYFPKWREATTGVDASSRAIPTKSVGSAAPTPDAASDAQSTPELVTMPTTQYGDVRVLKSELESDKKTLRMFTKDGKPKGQRINRENFDQDGSKKAQSAKEAADNPLFDIVTTKSGTPFKARSPAVKEQKRLGLTETHEVKAVEGGFVVVKKTAQADKPSAKEYLATVKKAQEDAQENAKNAPKETIDPTKDTLVGENMAGDSLYDREDGQRYRMSNNRPNFGGDLSLAEQSQPVETSEPAEPEKKAGQDRFEAGKSLTKEQRKAVLATLVDVYKAKDAPRESKGIGRDGNERSGYAHSPELFEKSDITGAMIRYYVTLPDKRIAHPSELFPDYTQNDINNEIERRANAEKRNREFARQYYLSDTFDTKREAAIYWNDKSEKSMRTAQGKPTIFDAMDRTHITDGKKFAMIPTDVLKNQDMMDAIKAEGWSIATPTAATKPTEPAAQATSEEAGQITLTVENALREIESAKQKGKEALYAELSIIRGLSNSVFNGVAKKITGSHITKDGVEWSQETLSEFIMSQKANAGTLPSNKSDEQKPNATPLTKLEAEKALWARLNEGKSNLEEFKAGFDAWIANKPAIIEEFLSKKKDELFEIGGPYFTQRYKAEAKPQLAELLWRQAMSDYSLGKSITYGMGKDSYQNAVRVMVEATDEQALKDYADQIKERTEEVQASLKARQAGIDNPQTHEDFRNIMAQKVRVDGMTVKDARLTLTPEQRAKMDELDATLTRAKRKSTQEVQKAVRVAGQKVDATIVEAKHTQKGHDLFVVQLAERLEREDYDTLNIGAKRLGGYYSAFRGRGAVPGFQFKDRASAEALVKLANGDNTDAQELSQARRDSFADDKSQSASERLTEMADRLEERADATLNADRKVNTARRARFAASAENAANADKAMAKTMRNVAQAISSGKAKFIDRLRQKTQVELLQSYVKRGMDELIRAKYPAYIDQQKQQGSPATQEAADYADFPTYTAFRSDLASLARQLVDVDGTKLVGQRLLKVADDVSAAYLKFAKENTASLMQFKTRDGEQIPTFSTENAALATIARSGFKGKAIPYQIKRGQYTIILSPSEAINRGIWKGDGDTRITLSPEFGAELVEKIGKASRRGSKVSVPWQLETAHDRRQALSRMDIETSYEFRAALREFISLSEQPQAPNKIKELERKLVGRKNDGLDFFPTPASVVDEMVAAADIQEGMSVLEPSAGMGHIAERIREAGYEVDVVEMESDKRELLEAKGFQVIGSDFMDMNPRGFTYGDVFKHSDGRLGILGSNGGLGSSRYRFIPLDGDGRNFDFVDREDLTGVEKRNSSSGYDRIIMNPPFSDGRDIQHVKHAYTLLKPGGRIVAIMGESAFTNQNKRATEFREWLEEVGGTEEKLPDGTFLDPSLPVNTGANARMVVIEKAAGGLSLFTQPSRALSNFRKLTGDPSASTAKADAEAVLGMPSPVPVLTEANYELAEKRVPMWYDLNKKAIYYNTAYKDHDRARDAQWMTEEIMHAVDHIDGTATISASSETLRKGGELRTELEAAVKRGGALYDILRYPLDMQDKFTEDRIVAELFARTAVVYNGFPDLLRAAAPKTYEVFHGFFQRRNEAVRSQARRDSAVRGEESGGLGTDRAGSAGTDNAGQAGDKLARFRDEIAAGLGGNRDGRGTDLGGLTLTNQQAASRGTNTTMANRKDVVGNQGGRSADDISQVQPYDERKALGADGQYRYQFQANTDGGQTVGNQMRVKQNPDGSWSQFTAVNGAPERLTRVRDQLNDVLPSNQAVKLGWAIPVKSFDDPRSVAHGKTSDSANEPTAPNGGGAFSNPSILATVDGLTSDRIASAARNVFSDTMTSQKRFNWWNNTVGTQYQKASQDRHFKRVFESTQEYIGDISRLANDAADRARDLLPRLESFSDVIKDIPGIDKNRTSKADIEAISKPIFQGTLADTRVYGPKELKSRFGLTDKQIGLYKQFREAVDKSLDDLTTSTVAKMIRSQSRMPASMIQDFLEMGDHEGLAKMLFKVANTEADLKPLANQVMEVSDRAKKLKGEGYAPLMRFGRFAVSLREPITDQLQEFHLFESQLEANKFAREKNVSGDFSVSQSVMSQEDFKLLGGVSPESLELFGDILEKAGVFDTGNEVFQQYLRTAIDNRSAMKRMIERQGYPGYSQDVRRVLAAFVTSNARLASKNLHFTDMLEAAENVPKEKGDVRDEAAKLVEYVKNPIEEAAKIRGLLFVQYIGGSVASALVNMTQSLTMTYPYLSQFSSPAKAAKIIGQAMKSAVSKPSGDLGDALARAEQSGIVQPQEIHHLNAEAMATFGSNPAVQKALFVWGSMFSIAEQYNRRVAFIAGYNSAPEGANAYDFAVRAVEETQGVYTKANRPNWARGALGATLFTFKQFSIGYLEFLTRLPNREKALALGILMLAAGAEGLPFADDLDDVIDTIAQRMGYAFNSKEQKRKFIAAHLGEGAADFILKGVSTGLPIDISGRMGMANLLPGTGILREDVTAQGKAREIFEVLGPAGGVVQDATKGEFWPVAIRNLQKSLDMFQTGMYRDEKGRKVVDTGTVDALWKSLGFQPAEVAKAGLGARIANQTIRLAKVVEAEIADEMAQARFEGDAEKLTKARERLREWNTDNPEARIFITQQQILRRLSEIRKTRQERVIKAAPKELRQYAAAVMQ